MGVGGPAETKKAICRSLTNVVKASPLKDAIDPKAFFMMINTNFPVLFSQGTLNLGPLWDALAQQHSPELLVGVFLKFQEAMSGLGLPVGLPPAVRELSPAERDLHLQRFDGGQAPGWEDAASGMTPLVDLEPVPGGGQSPVPLSNSFLKPLISDEVKRRVTQTVVQAVRQTAISQKIEGAQLAFWIDSNFDTVCDGSTFNFGPLYEALRELEVSDSDVYLSILRSREALRAISIEVEEPKLELDPGLKDALQRQLKRENEPATPSASRPALKAEGTKDIDPNKPKREDFGFGKGKVEKAKKTGRIIRIAVLTLLGAVCVGYGWLTRPNRGLDPEEFAVPMTSSQLVRNSFSGTLDETHWYTKTFADRMKAVKSMEAQLKEHGWIAGAQIRDNQHRLVIAGSGTKLIPSKFVIWDRLPANDTTVPKDDPNAIQTGGGSGDKPPEGGAAQK